MEIKLHIQWSYMRLKQYTPDIHKGMAAIYICDEEFSKYYGRKFNCCVQILKDVVNQYVVKKY